LSYGARLTLLRACLASISIYLMFVIKFPKWAVKAINSQMANFFWNDQENNHKYHLSNWQSLAQKVEFGGLGVPDLRDLNLCPLASWVQRYYEVKGKIWKVVVDQKYRMVPNIFCRNPRNSSPFWRGVVWAAKAAKLGFRWKVGNVRRVRFWEDLWLGTCSLAIQYWDVYSIIFEQGKIIYDAWDGVNLKFTFRRTVDSATMEQWYEILQIASTI
jgi:hypothetical protein